MATSWSTADMPDLSDKVAIVTGSNSGIGYHTALQLARSGAIVILACRDALRGREAQEQMSAALPGAKFQFAQLDLANLNSVARFAKSFLDQYKILDILVNNAGVMALPTRQLTVDGFEFQFGTNHLGHFALTGMLLPALAMSKAARVVTVSSGVAFFGNLEMDNLQSEQKYVPLKAYSQSKLANLLFMEELGRRQPWLTSTASHPGATITNLQKYAFKQMVKIMGQHASQGALPSLRAAVEECNSGRFFAPGGFFNMAGSPVQIKLPRKALDNSLCNQLWTASEKLTAVNYNLAAANAKI